MLLRGSFRVIRPYIALFLITIGLIYVALIIQTASNPHEIAKFGLVGADVFAGSVDVDQYNFYTLEETVNIEKSGKYILYTTISSNPPVNVEVYATATGEQITVKPNLKLGKTILQSSDQGIGVPQKIEIPAWILTIPKSGEYQVSVSLTDSPYQEPSFTYVSIKRDMRFFNYLFLTIGSIILLGIIVLVANAIYYVKNKAQLQAESQQYEKNRSKWNKFTE